MVVNNYSLIIGNVSVLVNYTHSVDHKLEVFDIQEIEL